MRCYSVYFLDSSGRLIGEPAQVPHGAAAAPPAWRPPENEVFLAWSRDLSHITEDTYCVALTRARPEPKTYAVTFYDAAGFALDEEIVEEGAVLRLPGFTPPAGFRFLGWECFALEGKRLELLAPDALYTREIRQDSKFCAKCEPLACRVLTLDMRAHKPVNVIPLGSVGYGAVLTQEDLDCLHLRHTERLRPFRLQVTCDALLVLTPTGVRAFDRNMRPLEMLELVPHTEREIPQVCAVDLGQQVRKEA